MDVVDLAHRIENRFKGDRPKDNEEFASFIWNIFQLQLCRVVELAKTGKFYGPYVSRDLEVVYRLGDLYSKLLGPKQAENISEGLKAIVQAASSGNAERLRLLLKDTPS